MKQGQQKFPYLDYGPQRLAFHPVIVDIYMNQGNIPPQTNPQQANVPCLLTGSPFDGFRQKVQATCGFTHIALFDPAITILDGYRSNSQGQNTSGQYILAIPSTTDRPPVSGNFYIAVFQFQTLIPGAGLKQVVLLDRRTPIGSWPKLL
jgi:hypothetical protein